MIFSWRKVFFHPAVFLTVLIVSIYWQFFLQGKVPLPADTLVGAYYPWLDYKWGFPAGVPVKNPPISDVFSQFFLWKYLAIDIIKSGSWPLWNNYSFSGTPLLATYHSAPFFPFNILLYLPKYFGWGVYIFLQTLIAALGMYLLSGRYVKSSFARIGGSLVFSLSGLMTTWAEFGTGVWAAAMLPWIFYFLLVFLSCGKIRFLLMMTLSFIILFLAGHAQLTLYSSIIFPLFLVSTFFTNHLILKKYLIPVILFWLFSIFIVALQFLPAFDLVRDSVRVSEAYSKTFNYGLNPWYEVIRLSAADFFGNPTTYNHWDIISYHEQSSFLGSVTLPLIIPLFFKRNRPKELLFWGLLFIISILFAFDNFITRFIYSLPLPFLTYSSASRAFFLTSFSAGILVALALNLLQTKSDFIGLVRKTTAIFLVLFGFIILGIFLMLTIFKAQASLMIPEGVMSNLSISMKNSLLPFILLTLLFVLSYLFRIRKWLPIIIVLLLFLDLGRYFLKYNPFVQQELIFPSTKVHEFLINQEGFFRISRADSEIMPPNTWIAYQLQSIEGYDPLALANYASYFSRLNGTPYEGRLSRYVEVSKYPSNFLNALNTKYLLGVKRDEKGNIGGNFFNKELQQSNYKTVFEDKNSVVFLNPEASERLYIAQKVTVVNSRKELIEKINDSKFDPVSESVIIENGSLPVENGQGSAYITDYKPNKIVIDAKTDNPAFLVIAESYEKGWNLLVNQKPAKLYEVNGALRGVFLPKGESRVILNYWPNAFDIGLKITFFSLVIFALINLYALIKRQW